jgi:hypothetical protein
MWCCLYLRAPTGDGDDEGLPRNGNGRSGSIRKYAFETGSDSPAALPAALLVRSPLASPADDASPDIQSLHVSCCWQFRVTVLMYPWTRRFRVEFRRLSCSPLLATPAPPRWPVAARTALQRRPRRRRLLQRHPARRRERAALRALRMQPSHSLNEPLDGSCSPFQISFQFSFVCGLGC